MAGIQFSDIIVRSYKYQPIKFAITDNPAGPQYSNLPSMPPYFSAIKPEHLLPPTPWNVNAEIKSFRTVRYNYGRISHEVVQFNPVIAYCGWNGKFERPTFGSAKFDAGTISLSQSSLAPYKGISMSAAFVGSYSNALLDGATTASGTMKVSEDVLLTNVFESIFPNLGAIKIDLKKGLRRKIAPPSKLVSSIGVLFEVPEGTHFEPTTKVKYEVLDANDSGADVVHISDIVAIDEDFFKSNFNLAKALFDVYQAYRTDFSLAAQTAGWKGDPVARKPVIMELHYTNPTNENEYYAYTVFQRDNLPSGGHIDKMMTATTNFGLSDEMSRGGALSPLFKNTKGLLNELSGLLEQTHYSALTDNSKRLLDSGTEKINDFSKSMGV